MTTCSTPDCLNPIGLPCHACGKPLCWTCARSFFLVVHCPSCWEKSHERESTAQQRASTPTAPRPRSPEPAVGDVCLLPGGQHLLIVDIWHAEPPAVLGRATCLLGVWDGGTTFVPVVPHQSALFGFTGPRSLPFERVGGIDADVARRIYHDGQTLLAVASGASRG